jgi:hypothetical protein
MKISLSMAAILLATVSAFSAGAPRTAAAAECTGPFRQCAIDVRATCSRDADGKQRMTYWDYSGNTISFERCVGGIFEAAGQANPYKTGATSARGRSAGLTVPYTELLYPIAPTR